MKKLKFKNGDEVHAIGLGTWKARGNDLKNAVKNAIYAGYRHIDTATNYGNEEIIGEALAEIFAEGSIFREDIFITSKLWNDAHGEGQVIPALEDSLKRLQLDYLDLYLIHWPVVFRNGVNVPKTLEDYISLDEVPIIDTWKQMEQAKKNELTKHIGVSNFSIKKLKDLISKVEIKPEMNQVEMHPLLQQKQLLDFCKKEEILMTAYSPLGSGDRSSRLKAESEPDLMEIPEIMEIAKKHNALPSQILIAWHTERGCAVIPKSTTKDHIISNFQSAGIELTSEDMDKIGKLDRHFRFITGKFFEEPSKGYVNLYDE